MKCMLAALPAHPRPFDGLLLLLRRGIAATSCTPRSPTPSGLRCSCTLASASPLFASRSNVRLAGRGCRHRPRGRYKRALDMRQWASPVLIPLGAAARDWCRAWCLAADGTAQPPARRPFRVEQEFVASRPPFPRFVQAAGRPG